MPPLNKLQKSGLALAISQLLCHSAQAATITVNSIADSLDTAIGTECTLRKAVESVNEQALKPGCLNPGSAFGDADTITVAPSLGDQKIILAGSQLVVGNSTGEAISTTIQGNGVTIDGDERSRVFQVQEGDSLAMDFVTITRGSTVGNGDGNSKGAGIELRPGSTLNLSNSTLTNNTARRSGGAIAAGSLNGEIKPTATLKNTTVTQNVSQFNDGAGLHFYRADLTIEDSVLSENTALGETATGAGASLRYGRFELNRVSISGNQAGTANGLISGGGGLVFLGGTGDQLKITNTTVSANTAIGLGGGIVIQAGGDAVVEIVNTTISGNSATSNSGATGGAASIFGDGAVVFRNSTLVDNVASDDVGTPTNSGISLTDDGPEVVLQNTIIATPNGTAACEINAGTVIANQDSIIQDASCGTNVRAVNPRLGPLADNGGPTLTHALLAGSPAIDAAESSLCSAEPVNNLDQRGEPRDANCDIGAFEFTAKPSLAISTSLASIIEGNNGTSVFSFTVSRSVNIQGASSVDFTVASSGATPASAADFGGSFPSGSVSFAGGESTQLTSVLISGDTDIEQDEMFSISLSNPVNADIGTTSIVATIVNDDVDTDQDGTVDSIDPNDDNDSVADSNDNCQFIKNDDQLDTDSDLLGDACDDDDDGDNIADIDDVCPLVPDPDQADQDNDGVGDACEIEDELCFPIRATSGIAVVCL